MSANLFDSIPEADSESILLRSRERGQADATPYAGSIFPDEAWELFRRGDAKIVDVRTVGELHDVGAVPNAPNVIWAKPPAMQPNPDFVQDMSKVAQPTDTVLLLCRSSRRSVFAANLLAASGWTNTFNILEGFEGTGADGWLTRGLPTTLD
jgi:rhodanese-related sulfurtransferase